MAPTCNVVAAVRNEDIYKWIVATRGLDTDDGPTAALGTSLDAVLADRQCKLAEKEAPLDRTCSHVLTHK